MELKLVASGKTATKSVKVSENIFGQVYKPALVHQVVTAYLAAARAGTKAQKTRAEVSGGGAKPWRQKGTGRARAGTSRSPIWRGGGITFAAKPRCFEQKVNRKMYQGALRSILSELVNQDRLVVVEDFVVTAPKTKELLGKLKTLDLADVLIVTDKLDENLVLAARNLHQVDIYEANEVNPVNLLAYDKVLMTVSAIRQLEEWLG